MVITWTPQASGAGHLGGPAEHREQGQHAEHPVRVAPRGEEKEQGLFSTKIYIFCNYLQGLLGKLKSAVKKDRNISEEREFGSGSDISSASVQSKQSTSSKMSTASKLIQRARYGQQLVP